ncbi:MAG: hypothetical protein JXB15_09355 [Anaerolineales bacterium]|nr:hypothetical protein [Anaerolineales bacterium]
MDIVSHAIIGRILIPKSYPRRDIAWTVFFAALPDLLQIPLYAFLGCLNQRPFCYPLTSDWYGIRDQYPGWLLWWDIPHSYFFLLFVIVPVAWAFKLNKLVIAGYFSHLFVDLFTHTREWGVKPFFPLNFKVSGFTDAWAWDFYLYPISWAILVGIVLIADRIRDKKTARESKTSS